MKYGLILLFSLIITGQFTFGQSKYATINLAEFDIDPESSLEDGEVEPNLLIFFDPLSTANDFRLEFINGQISSVQLSMQLNFGGNTYEMEISGGAIYDETDTQISQSAINITDNLFFTIDDNTLYYVHNDLIIASKTVAPSGPVTFSLTNLANVDADIWVSISDGCIVMDDDDGDGVCNIFDICPNGDDNIDTDGDSIPDDCDPSCGLSGTPCDDGNPGTINDIYDNNCNCNGTIELSDCNLYDLEENSLEQLLDQGDIAFIGYDNDIGAEKDRIILTNLVSIRPGTKFSITNANYCTNTDAWYSPATQDGNLAIQTITYNGTEGLAPGSIICADVPAQGTGQALLLENISLNGAISDAFSVTNGGRDLNPDINLLTTGSSGLFILQGKWQFTVDEATFSGRHISALRIGDADGWTSGTCGTETNLPMDLECLEGPNFPATGSSFGYFDCSQYGSTFDRFGYLSTGHQAINWTQGSGTAGLDLPTASCTPVCMITCEALYWQIPPDKLSISCGTGYQDLIDNWIANYGNGSVYSTCTGPITVSASYDPTQLQFACTPRALEVKFTAKDECGQMATAFGELELLATGLPTFAPAPLPGIFSCATWEAEFRQWMDVFAGAQANDACGAVNISYDPRQMQFMGCGESTTITFKAVSTCGALVATEAVTFIIEDNQAPVVDESGLSDLTLNISETEQLFMWLNDEHGGASATDNCTDQERLEWTHTEIFNDGSCTSKAVSFTVVDECGNSTTTSSVNLTIQDTEAPSLNVSDLVLDIDEDPTQFNQKIQDWLYVTRGGSLLEYGVKDNYTAVEHLIWSAPQYTALPDQSSCSSETVTFTVEDLCGNSTTETAEIRVEDQDPPYLDPNITDPIEPIIMSCSGMNTTVFDQELDNWITSIGNGLILDDQSIPPIWSYSYRGEPLSKCETFNIIFTVTDACGNSMDLFVEAKIQDADPPVITPGTNFWTIHECDDELDLAAFQQWIESGGNSTVSDNCQTPFWLSPQVTLISETELMNTYEVVFRASDYCGNVDTFVATVEEVFDVAQVTGGAPLQLSCTCEATSHQTAIDDWLNAAAGLSVTFCGEPIVEFSHTAVDNNLIAACDPNTPSQTITFSFFQNGELIVEVDQTIEIIDPACQPVIDESGADLEITCGIDNQAAIDNWINNHGGITLMNACGTVSWSSSTVDQTKITNCENQPISFSWVDECGNSSNQILWINPVIPCPPDPSVSLTYDFEAKKLIAYTTLCEAPIYQWYRNGVLIMTQNPGPGNDAELNINQLGTYRVLVDNCTGCPSVENTLDVCAILNNSGSNLPLYCDCYEPILENKVIDWIIDNAGIRVTACSGVNVAIDNPTIYQLNNAGFSIDGCTNWPVDFTIYVDGVVYATLSKQISFSTASCSDSYHPYDFELECGTLSTEEEITAWIHQQMDYLTATSCGPIIWDALDPIIISKVQNCESQSIQVTGVDDCHQISVIRNLNIVCNTLSVEIIEESNGELCAYVTGCPENEVSYVWSNYGNPTSQCITPTISANYRVTVSCGNSTSGTCVDLVSAPYSYTKPCSNNFSVSLNYISSNGRIVANTTNACINPSYTWTFNGASFTPSVNAYTHQPTQAGAYAVEVDCPGCPTVSDSYFFGDCDTDAEVNLNFNSQTGELTALASNVCNDADYIWKLNGSVFTPSENETTHTVNSDGTYQVEVQCDGCPTVDDTYEWDGCTNTTVSIVSVADAITADINGNCIQPIYRWYEKINGVFQLIQGEENALIRHVDASSKIGTEYRVEVACQGCTELLSDMDCWCGPGFDGPYDWDGEENGNQIYTLTFTLDHSDFQACTDYLPQWDLSSNATLVSSTETVDIFNRQVFIAEVTDLDLYESFDATLEVGCNSCCVYSKTVEDLYVTGVGNLIGGQQTYSSISSLPPTSNQIRLFPNPAKSSFNIGFETEEEQDLTITIFDTAGQQLLESQKAAIKGDNLYPFDISPYPAGLYLVQIQTGSVVYHQKFLITKN